MSVFSDTLSRFMEQKQLKVYQLSKLTGIERTSLHKMSQGTRPAHKEILGKLAIALKLTPDETKELQKSFDITEIGEAVYYRREAVYNLLCAFHENPVKAECEVALHPSIGSLSHIVAGQFQMQQLMKVILDAETEHDGFIRSNSLPSHTFLMSMIQSVASIAPRLQIRHVICFENKSGEMNDTVNIRTLQHIIALLLSCENYEAFYYYGSVSDRFDSLTPFSNVLLTSQYALLFSDDEQFGVLIDDHERVHAISEWFHEMESHTNPIAHKFASPLEHLVHYKRMDSTMFAQAWEEPKEIIYSIAPHPCVAVFLTEEIYQAHLADMPGRSEIIDMLAEHINTYHDVLRNDTFVHYFTSTGLSTLMEEGRWLEIPDEYYTPLAPRYRLQLLQSLCEECRTGRFQMRIYDETSVRVPQNLCVYMDGDIISFIYIHSKRGYLSFSIAEPFFVQSLYDYMRSLATHQSVWSLEETTVYLDQQLEKYKTVWGLEEV